MYYLKNDYSEGCHPALLEALTRTNLEATTGYGLDPYCQEAADKIKKVFSCPDADVHFLVGGTQANLTMISHILRPYEAAITVTTGHIAVHESGAVEATGHKVLTYEDAAGKVRPAMVEQALLENPDEHTVSPAMVYLSNATEIGTVYKKAELEALHECCKAHGLYLYMDGARLGTALTSPENDLKPEDLPRLCDAFYIGGTKNGALFGEAMVIVNDQLKGHFRTSIKQKGGMLAKGRLLGVQFSQLFTDDLWFRLAQHANTQAANLQNGLVEKGVPLMVSSPTNQIFPIFSDAEIQRLSQDFAFEIWGRQDETHSIIRLVTSWATQPETVEAFLRAI
jgi:threonine aldolase